MFTGIDHLLAQHIAHLFIRDPISLFSEKIKQDDQQDTDHFEVRAIPLFHLKMSGGTSTNMNLKSRAGVLWQNNVFYFNIKSSII